MNKTDVLIFLAEFGSYLAKLLIAFLACLGAVAWWYCLTGRAVCAP